MARRFKNRFAGLKSSSFARPKSPKAFMKSSVLSDNRKGCEAEAFGTHAKRHTDECPQRLEQLIRDDEVLRVRLGLRDVRLNRDAECEKYKRPEELKLDELMGEAEAAGGKVAEDLLVNDDNIVDAETFEEETSDANLQDANKERPR